ncbi:MAG: hypothetical protein KC621_05530 [Myxococcales bacterium]|nr:hypothetical protein [Myxococcales bacterium]
MLWPVFLLAGCPFVSDARLGDIRDGDGDGIAAPRFGGDDCNDDDPDVGHALPQWTDADGDGFGDPGAPGPATCVGTQEGFADNDLDCNDTDPFFNPLTAWFVDADHDGYGDPGSVPTAACVGDGAKVVDDTDCDDTDPDVHPGAPDDAPLDGIDTDCDGGTELDVDGDGFADIAGCVGGRAIEVAGQAELVAALTDGLDCDQLLLADGDYGPIVVRRPVSLLAAPGAHPTFVADVPDADAIRVTSGVTGLTLERLTFVGFDEVVAIDAATTLLGSRLLIEGGEAVLAPPGSSVTLYDSAFVGVGRVTGFESRRELLGPDTLELVRARISLGVAADVLLLGGGVRTALVDVAFEDVAALGAVVRVPSGALDIDGLTFDRSLGRVLEVENTTGGQLRDIVVRRGATTASQLLRVAGPSTAHVEIVGLVVEDNEWTIDLDDVDVLTLLERQYSLVRVGGVELVMQSSRIVGNTVPTNTSLLYVGDLDIGGDPVVTIENTVLAGSWERGEDAPDSGTMGLIVYGPPENKILRNLTIANLRDTAIYSGSGFTLSDSIVTNIGRAISGNPVLPFTFERSVYYLAGSEPCQGCVEADPLLARSAPGLEGSFRDFHPLPGSPAVALGGVEVGATGGPSGDGASYREDVDGDGLPDGWERAWCDGDCAPHDDADEDGLDALEELAAGTLPLVPDTDGDGLSDGTDPEPTTPR